MTRLGTPLPLSDIELRHLCGGKTDASLWGEPDWGWNVTAWRARFEVSMSQWSSERVLPRLHVEMEVRPKRRSEPTIVLLNEEEHRAHIDVNGMHRGERSSHVQYQTERAQAYPLPDWFYSPPHGDTVRSGDYERIFRGSCKFFGIDTSAVAWVDPDVEVD